MNIVYGNGRKDIPQHRQRYQTYQGSKNTAYHFEPCLIKALNSHKMEENPKKTQTIIGHTINGEVGDARIIDTVKWEDILVCKKSYTGIFSWISIRYPKIDSLSSRLLKIGRDAHGDNDWNHIIVLHKETSSVANIEIPSHEG